MSQRIIDSFPQTRNLPVKVVRLGLVSKIFSGGTPDKSREAFWDGDLPWLGSGSVNQRYIVEPTAHITREAVSKSSTRLFPKGSLTMALAGQGKTKAMIARLGINAYGNQSMACIHAYKGEVQFLFWWLQSIYKEIRALSSDDTRDGLNQSIVGQLPVPLFDLPTQKRIAAFLDRETARVDELIAKKERLVEVLWQRTRSMIDLLTSPDSDDDDWVARPIKALCSINGRIGFRGYTVDDIVAEHEGAITLSPSNIKNGNMRFDSCTYLSWKKYFESPEIQVAEGDIVFVKTGSTIGKVARIDSVHTEMTINPQLVVLKGLKVDGDFLLYSMQSSDFEYQVSYNQFGGSTPAMSQGNLGRLTVWIPKVDGKAKQIAATIKAHNTSVAKQRELINISIDRLREYRAALITAAVTGQIDVETYGKAGNTSETLDRIEEEMQA